MAVEASHTETKGPRIVVVNAVFLALATVAVILRLFTRARIVSSVGPEDYLLIGALVTCGIETAFQLLEVKYGAGRHMATLDPIQIPKQLQNLYLSIIFYGLSLGLVKSSLILQYLRIFVHRRTQLACHILLVFVILYSGGTVLAATFTCWPVAAFWNPTIPGARCINKTGLWFSNAGFNIFTDFAILLIPLPALKVLHLPRRQKIGIMLIFAIGSFACITSILRLHYLYVVTVSKDITWDNAGGIIWSSIEVNVFIICACLTGLKPLFTRVTSRMPTGASSLSLSFSKKRATSIGMLPLSEQETIAPTSKVKPEESKVQPSIPPSDVESTEILPIQHGDQHSSQGGIDKQPRKSHSSDRLLIQTIK